MSSEVRQRIQELKELEQVIREKTISIARDAVSVFRVDLPLFVEREVKKAFIADPDFGEALSDEQLRALKQEIAARGQARAAELFEALEEWELWMQGVRHVDGARSLEAHEDLWIIVDRISEVVRDILEEHGFPEQSWKKTEIHYRQPTWFIAGLLMTTVAEKYWQKMKEWAEVKRELEELDIENRRKALKRRWAEIR